MPWTGLMYNFDGEVKNCIRSAGVLGNIQDTPIENILTGPINLATQANMLEGKPGKTCYPCYELEQDKKSFDIISDRVFYLKELKEVDNTIYDRVGNFGLHTIDVRWSNVCNFACVYCGPEFSSKIATEMGIQPAVPLDNQKQQFKEYIFSNAAQLKHVYMAGGEPLLMKENLELLELLKQVNPNVNLRINTNLSKVDTRVFDLICTFPNVHWIVSIETIEEEYEYIRYGSSWSNFLENLTIIKQLDNKVSINMLYFVLNTHSFFNCVKFLQGLGFHNNSFIVGALIRPDYFNIRHLPDHMLTAVQQTIQDYISQKPGFLLEDGLKNVLQYTKSPITKNIDYCLSELAKIDQRRGIDSKKIFNEFYNLIERGK